MPPRKRCRSSWTGCGNGATARATLGADRGYDTKDCVKDIRAQRMTPHVAQKKHSAIDGRTTRHAGHGVSLRLRKRVEEACGRMKTVGGLRRTRYRGVARRARRLPSATASEAEPVPPG